MVVWNMRGCDEGKIKSRTDCYKVWQLLTSGKLKASQFTGDGVSIIRKIIELESETKIEFVHEYVKTKNGNDNAILNKGLTMVLECDQKVKEERIKSIRESRDNNGLWVINAPLKCGKETLEKLDYEVIRCKVSDSNCEEHMQHKNG